MQSSALASTLDLLRQARRVVALTGAGISTPSGIPDFRSPRSGLWQHVDPVEVASIAAFRNNPARFYDWLRPLVHSITAAQPNSAHRALAQMEARGRLQAIITQNIDMLHTKAGSEVVHEIHGSLREATCIHCFVPYPAQVVIEALLDGDLSYPRCAVCGHALKPNVILYGEQLPAQVLLAAQRAAAHCDVMIVVGSSLEVYPSADLPMIARRNGAALIMVNLTPTPFDSVAQVVVHTDAAEFLPQIAEALDRTG